MLGSLRVKRYKVTKKEPVALFQYHLNNQVQRFGSIISVVGKTTVEIIELFECTQKVP